MGQSGLHIPKDDFVISCSNTGNSMIVRATREGKFRALKVLKAQFRGDKRAEALLRKEFEIGYGLNHPNICQIIGFGNDDALGNFIEMEWVDGVTLRDLMDEGPLNAKSIGKILTELCDALEYIHRKQVVHKDLKPENILITNNGQNVKIIDFGFSDADEWFDYKIPSGTYVYASPEQLAGRRLDARSDIYSLGVIIRELAGKRYSRISARCMKRLPERRYDSAATVKKRILHRPFLCRVLIVSAFILIAAAIIALCIYRSGENDRIFDAATQSILDLM